MIERKNVNPRRVITAYGDEKLYKVQAVTVIPPLKSLSLREKNHRSKQNTSNSAFNELFEQKLEDTREKEQQKDIRIQVNSYTKNALPLYYLVNMREYR